MEKIKNPNWLYSKILLILSIIVYIPFIIMIVNDVYTENRSYFPFEIGLIAFLLLFIPISSYLLSSIPRYLLLKNNQIILISSWGKKRFSKEDMSHYDRFLKTGYRIIVKGKKKKFIELTGYKKEDQIRIISRMNLTEKPYEYIPYLGYCDWVK